MNYCQKRKHDGIGNAQKSLKLPLRAQIKAFQGKKNIIGDLFTRFVLSRCAPLKGKFQKSPLRPKKSG